MAIETPNFIPGTEAWTQKMDEALRTNVLPLDVHCFGAGEYKIIGDKVEKKTEQGVLGLTPFRKELDLCPICGRLIRIWYIPGTQPVGTCSIEHTKQVMGFIAQQYKTGEKRRGTYRIVGD